MSRPKGSKNKSTLAANANAGVLLEGKLQERKTLLAKVEKITAEIEESKLALTAAKKELRSVERQIVKLEAMKAEAVENAKNEETKAALQGKINELIKKGKSAEDILNMLK